MKTKQVTQACRFLIFTLFCILLFVPGAVAEETGGEELPYKGWKQASTNHFRFIYEDAFRPQAEAFAEIADSTWNSLSKIYGSPPQKTDIILSGRQDIVNGYAHTYRYNIGLYVNPPLSPVFGYRDEWTKIFFTHELTHIANFTFNGHKNIFSTIFGPFWNTFSVMSHPDWAIEGLGTVLETELTNGGRGRSPYFELLFKAPALENGFIKFREIGRETEPPEGQIYVMGYLIMRSIADRWGISSLAEIEKNKSKGFTYAASVKMVTGYTPEEIYQDVRIALTKKYHEERTIPEGKTISPRSPKTNYFPPALVTEDTIITLRDTRNEPRAAVSFSADTGEETVLFEADFADELSLTAAENGTVVAALQSVRRDKMPGFMVSTDLYKWRRETGLIPLTSGTSLFQPAISRDGSRLVAVELAGLHYRLVEVDLRTGERKVLIESETESYISPALSQDGSEIAFLIITGERAILASSQMPKYEFAYPVPQRNINRLVNINGGISDIAYPSWKKDGSIQFSSNERGRLEVWEYKNGQKRPVVSDPVGALWSETISKGIVYASYASTGYVVKIKPAKEWAIVPDFEGPSAPGSVITLGTLVSDYPGFNPYPATGAEKNIPEPGISTLYDTGTQQNLQNEKRFVNIPKLDLWLPLPTIIFLPEDSVSFGIGAFAIFSSAPLRRGMPDSAIVTGGSWYPAIGQFSLFFLSNIPLYTGQFIICLGRDLEKNYDGTVFYETNSLQLSYAVPFYSRSFYYNRTEFAAFLGLFALTGRNDTEVFSVGAGISYDAGIGGRAGVDFYFRKNILTDLFLTVKATPALLISIYPTISTRTYVSGELLAGVSAGTEFVQAEFGLRSRWLDLPEEAPLTGSLATIRGLYSIAYIREESFWKPESSFPVYSINGYLRKRFFRSEKIQRGWKLRITIPS
ncbi:hypothetical protein K7I13_04670 [Brucepastera parasyntrophica]|uniref:TolB family protein n=1 Tax=Brucepastera parasyntrophica TaxID=2880008 RepID=UPI00210BFBCB|nr:hypothetical protein [Brucepastera parasyntrophica]ULQ60580.1 hypothetical protein K7I13_04670 [Brucepastera parasyntrophica]